MDEKFYPNTRQSFVLIIFFYASYIIYFTLIGFLLLQFNLIPRNYFKTVLFAGSSISLLPLIIFFSKKSGVPLQWHVKFPGIKIILLMLFLSIAVRIVSSPFDSPAEYFDNLFNWKLKLLVFGVADIDLNMAIHAISSVLIGPIFEEYFFRKQVLGQLLQRLSPFVAILISSALFAAGHWRIDDLGALFIWGIFYGIVYYKTKSVETSILLHSFSNSLIFFYKYNFQTINETKLISYTIMVVISIVVILFIINNIIRINKIDGDFPKKVQAESLNEGI